MLKIKKTIINREITFDDFRKLKGIKPFKSYRQTGKQLNFLLLFGGSEMIFAENALETNWTPEQCEDFIKENHCQQEIIDVQNKYRGISDEELPFVVVAKRLRDNFFKGYPELMDRIYMEKTYASLHGFCRSFFGAVRNTIELKLRGEYDKKENSGIMRNLENITANMPIQNMEASISKKAIWRINNWLKDEGMKTYVWNEIHDSCDFCVYKPELEKFLKKAKYELEKPVPEIAFSPIRLVVDCEVSDLKTEDYYKGGRDPVDFGVNWKHLTDDADYKQEGYIISEDNFKEDEKWMV